MFYRIDGSLGNPRFGAVGEGNRFTTSRIKGGLHDRDLDLTYIAGTLGLQMELTIRGTVNAPDADPRDAIQLLQDSSSNFRSDLSEFRFKNSAAFTRYTAVVEIQSVNSRVTQAPNELTNSIELPSNPTFVDQSRLQLLIEDTREEPVSKFGFTDSLGQFDATKDTFVFVHGWRPGLYDVAAKADTQNPRECLIANPRPTHEGNPCLRDYVFRLLAESVGPRTRHANGPEANLNVLAWNWELEATGQRTGPLFEARAGGALANLPPVHKVDAQAELLSKRLVELFTNSNYSGDVFLVGHSLGGGIVARAVDSNSAGKKLGDYVKNLTILDAPDTFEILVMCATGAASLPVAIYSAFRDEIIGCPVLSLQKTLSSISGKFPNMALDNYYGVLGRPYSSATNIQLKGMPNLHTSIANIWYRGTIDLDLVSAEVPSSPNRGLVGFNWLFNESDRPLGGPNLNNGSEDLWNLEEYSNQPFPSTTTNWTTIGEMQLDSAEASITGRVHRIDSKFTLISSSPVGVVIPILVPELATTLAVDMRGEELAENSSVIVRLGDNFLDSLSWQRIGSTWEEFQFDISFIPPGEHSFSFVLQADSAGQQVEFSGLRVRTVEDADGDGVTGLNDNCPTVSNVDQVNGDGDLLGDSCDWDSDNDGLSDIFEATAGLSPTNSSDALSDMDLDGFSAFAEHVAGSDATDMLSAPAVASAPVLYGAVLPASRSVPLGLEATAFATIINSSDSPLEGCALAPSAPLGARFFYQSTNSSNNRPFGPRNVPIRIDAGTGASFVFGLTGTTDLQNREILFLLACEESPVSVTPPSLGGFLFSTQRESTPDVVALAATLQRDGTVWLAENDNIGAFSVATINVGTTGELTVAATFSEPLIQGALGDSVQICQTDPANGVCFSSPSNTISKTFAGSETSTFSVFVLRNARVDFDPAANRVFFRISDSQGTIVGATSVAVRSE